MAKIKEGYNDIEMEIIIKGRRDMGAELWIKILGLPKECERYRETLSYMSLQELSNLKREIEDAILEVTGISRS